MQGSFFHVERKAEHLTYKPLNLCPFWFYIQKMKNGRLYFKCVEFF